MKRIMVVWRDETSRLNFDKSCDTNGAPGRYKGKAFEERAHKARMTGI